LTEKGQILRSASVIAVVTAISRICGYLRDQRIALLLGTSGAADALVLAFRIPSMIRRMVTEGSLGASFIPIFAKYLRERPQAEAWAFAQKVFWDIAAILAVIAILGVVLSRQLVCLFTLLGGHSVRWDLAVTLNRIIFPSVLFLVLAALAGAILNCFHIFGLPAATPIFFNLTLIVASLGFVYTPLLARLPERLRTPAVPFAMAILLGSALQLVLQIPALWRQGMRFTPDLSIADPGVRKVGALMGPSFFGMGVYQVNLFVDTLFATSARMPAGSVMSLYVGDRVMQLVLGSYAIAMSTALLPAMSRQVAAGQYGEMKRTFAFSLRVVSFIAVPAAVGLILLRRPIIQVLFQHGQFVAESTALTARALMYYSLGLPAFAAIKLITPMYYSAQDTVTPARVGAWALAMNVALNAFFLLVLVRVLANGGPALASSISAYFNFVLLFLIFRRRYGRLGGRAIARAVARIGVCAGVMAAACVAGTKLALTPALFGAERHFLSQVAMLVLVVAASVTVYLGLARILRCEELGELFLLFQRRDADAGGSGADT
jgi:putative peptidoglycan lipid II flippase